MSFYDIKKSYIQFDFDRFFKEVKDKDILRALSKETLDEKDFLSLLSEKADGFIEAMAKKSHEVILKNFGKVIYLYAPLYLGNFCDNECVYCGFKRGNDIERKKLSLDEVRKEAKIIAETGIRHILILTGESRSETPVSYIKDSVSILKKYFTSISIEVYPMNIEEYSTLISAGVDGIAVYQETYDEILYKEVHLKGPKRNYLYRLDAPERACRAGMRSISIGALLGLSDFRKETFFSGLHAAYLQNKHPGIEISVSLPRLCPQTGGFSAKSKIEDADFVRMILALRLFLPRAGINISTRERNDFRKNLIGLGVTRMSAGSQTEVGGYSSLQESEGQFFTADKGSVKEVKEMIYVKGYQPIMKDWQEI
jgi:2-iminoacetate synthase